MNNVTLIFLGVIAFLALVGALKGLSRGFPRQLIRTLTVVGSAFLAVWLTKLCYTKVFSPFFDGRSTEEILQHIERWGFISADQFSWLTNFDSATIKYILTLPMALVVSLVSFVVLFIVISALALLVHVVICGLLGFRKVGNGAVSRTLGLILGAAQGAAVALLLLVPVIGYAGVYADTVAILNEEIPEDNTAKEVTKYYKDYVESTYNSPVTKLVKKAGADKLFDYLVTEKVDEDTTIKFTDEIPNVAYIYAKVMKLSGADWKSLTPEQEESVREIIAKVNEDDFISEIMAGLVRGAAACYTNGVVKIDMSENFNSLLRSIVAVFENTGRADISADLNTIADVYFVLSEDGVFVAFENGADEMIEIFKTRDPETGKTPINDVIDILKANPRTKALVSTIAEVTVSIMAEKLDLGEEGKQLYSSVKDGLESTLAISKEGKTEEEYVSEVSASISEALTSNGIDNVPQEVIDGMAQYVSDNELALRDASVEDIILTYVDAIADYYQNGTVPDEIPDIPGLDPNDIPEGVIK